MEFLPSLAFVRALQESGGRVYMVGGTLRDRLLGKAHKDFDLLVVGIPQNELIQLLRRHGRVQLIGRSFGVIKFQPHGWTDPPIDIALPRTETSTGIGHRDFDIAFDHDLPIEVDLTRRDFTINAMALDLANEQLVDPFGGYQDLQRHRLRQVSPQSFPEDPLRILRGVQFAARFSLHVEADTLQAMRQHAALITTVAPERIAEELRKLFQAPAPSDGFYLMHEIGMLPLLLPEVARLLAFSATLPCQEPAGMEHSRFARTMRCLDAVQQNAMLAHRGDLHLLLAALWKDCGMDATLVATQETASRAASLAHERMEALRLTVIGVQPELVLALLTHSAVALETLTSGRALRYFTHRVGRQEALMVLELAIAASLGEDDRQHLALLSTIRQQWQEEMARGVPLQLKDLAINGRDLQRLGIPPGPHLGKILQTLLEAVLTDPHCNTRTTLLAAAQQLHDDAST